MITLASTYLFCRQQVEASVINRFANCRVRDPLVMIDFNTNGRIIDLLYSPMRSLAYLGQYQIMKIIHHQSAPQSRITVYLLSSKFSFRQGDGFLKKPLGPFSWVEFPAGSVRLSVNYFAQLSVNATCEGCEELSAWIRRRGCQQFCILHDVTRFN